MIALIPWLAIAVLVLLVAISFLRPFRKSVPQKIKSKVDLKLPLFKEETGEEISPYLIELEPHIYPYRPELPCFYGIDRLLLLVRDPYWIYAYWEISATKQEEFTSNYGQEAWRTSQPVLRVYDVTGLSFNGINANLYHDIRVSNEVNNWHIEVGQPDHAFCVDLGRVLPDGRFITLLRSNVVTTPRASLSERVDEEWMWIEGIYRSISRLQFGVSSPLIIEEMAQRMGVLPLGISSPGFSSSKED